MNPALNTPTGRILQVAHNHPRYYPGGTELTALALHRQALASGLDSWYLGALEETQIVPNLGTQMVALSGDQREAALFTDRYSRFGMEQTDQFGFLREFKDYLEAIRPDIVHVHHLINFGLEALFVIRSTLPNARIVFTIHDYYLICANHGQLYKHESSQRCPGPTLTECLRCFPERRANDFAMRGLNIRNAVSLCDQLVSPSYFLKDKFDRYLGTGQRIDVVENGYIGADIPPAPARPPAPHVTFGYFGNISAVKGLADLLDAGDALLESGIDQFRLNVHGSQLFEDKVLYDRMQAAKKTYAGRIRFFGQYQAEDMGQNMAGVDCVVFPSVWWENAPLVIYEALYHGRQVVSYQHGGAPEILKRYGMGVIAERSDPLSLAEAMAKVVADRTLLDMTPTRPIPARTDLLAGYLRYYGLA